jgi:hypothetical protein
MPSYTIEFESFYGDKEWVSLDDVYSDRKAAEKGLAEARTRTSHEYRIVEDGVAPAKQDSKIAWAAKKVPLMAIALKSLFGCARVFGYGRKKHGAGNYLLASLSDGAGERYMGALLRHGSEMQELDGTWTKESLTRLDSESGLPHLDHLIATAIMLRGILTKEGALPMDPGEGLEPPKK